jgi:fructose-1,6-bisphosphatase
MDESILERRLVENEAIFRKFNERMQKRINEISKKASDGKQYQAERSTATPMYFFCECADEKCQQQIKIIPAIYNKIHEDNSQFILAPGHEIEKIEDVVDKQSDYYVVRKHMQPPKNPDSLNPIPKGRL